MKKAYTLLITIVLISTFSYLGVLILETKALKNQNLSNQYLYIQAKNHLNFFEDFVKDYDLKDMLLYQGVLAFELFTNTKADNMVIEAMRKGLNEE